MPLENKKLAREDLWVSLIVVCLAGIFIFYVMGLDHSDSLQTLSIPSKITESITEIEEVKIENKTYQRSSKLEEQVPEVDKTTYMSAINDSLSSEIKTGTLIHDTLISNIEPDSTNTAINIDTVTSKKVIQKNSSEVKVINEESKSTDCIIIVGSYRKIANADKMYKRLEKSGYQVFQAQYLNYKRIGIYSPCDYSTLQRNLANIRSKFASDATVFEVEK